MQKMYTPTSVAIVKGIDNESFVEVMEKLEPSYVADGNVK